MDPLTAQPATTPDIIPIPPPPPHPQEPSASTSTLPAIPTQPEPPLAARRPARRISRTAIEDHDDDDPSASAPTTGIRTRQSYAAANKAPRFKVKMSKGGPSGSSSAPKNAAYMHGYNRELDSSDDEDEGLAFEEQLIFRMPAGKECDKLREMVRNRDVGNAGEPEVSLEFQDSRRAVFSFGNSRYTAKLVDLPTITEAHKILENKQMFKVADISQMLLVEERLPDEVPPQDGDLSAGGTRAGSAAVRQNEGRFDIDDFIYPHGITPPMHWARKRRFRKRANKRNIETVEKEVERLMDEDEFAEKVEFEVVDESVLDHLSDSEMGDNTASLAAATPRPMSEDGDSQAGDMRDDAAAEAAASASASASIASNKRPLDRGQKAVDEEEEPEEDEVDEDLAAALDAALEEAEEEETDSEDDENGEEGAEKEDEEDEGVVDEDDGDAEEEDEDDDEDEEQAEQRIRVNQLEAECREIDALVRRKQADVDRAANPMIKQRLERSLKALQAELESKRAQLLALRQEREHRKEEAAQAEAEAEEERNREEEEKEKAELAARAEAEAAAALADGEEGDEGGSSPRKDGATPPATAAAAGKTATQTKTSQSRLTSLKEVLIGERSGGGGSPGPAGSGAGPSSSASAPTSLPASQRQSGSTSAAASPAAGKNEVPMEVDGPEAAAQQGQGQQRMGGEEEEEEDEEEDEQYAGDAGAAPNEDSDAEEDEGLWS
ncbi:hypothetical protein A4X13_0g4479 [Tilletia indica]|uniref:TAFII55 protein conserved region domain-containing protein n=1 Tax=Tilletia indica TaxID=43049 RepID=A0A177TIX1_9BASI|nr:hypothetical protein A4X13_0g4479 [Tilletia indica]